MTMDRRTFLKICGVAAGVQLLPSGIVLAAPLHDDSSTKGMLSDLTKCIGCGWCQQACRDWNQLPATQANGDQAEPCLSADTWTVPELHTITDTESGQQHRVFVKRQCMHCIDPACVSACPVGALQKEETGPVVYDPSRCIGCRYCMVACPFGVPKFEWDEALPRIQKCTFCADRQAKGKEPACSTACPTGAILFGDRDELIAEAESRIKADPDRYYNHVYGKTELGGTSWMYLSPVSFAAIGFPSLGTEPVTELSESIATYGTAGVAVSVAALLGGMYYWFNGRGKAPHLEVNADQEESDSK